MRREIIEALKSLAVGNIKKHKMNIEIYLKNPVGIGEHPDILAAVQDQIDSIVQEEKRLEVLDKYSWGLIRTYEECPNFSISKTSEAISKSLDEIYLNLS